MSETINSPQYIPNNCKGQEIITEVSPGVFEVKNIDNGSLYYEYDGKEFSELSKALQYKREQRLNKIIEKK